MLSRGAIYAIINMENGRYYIGSAAQMGKKLSPETIRKRELTRAENRAPRP